MKRLLIFFSAGCLGALANSMVVWVFGDLGITALLGVSIAPILTPAWLYPRIVWGGLWGLAFVIPMFRSKPLVKGTVISIFPTTAQLFYFFPQTNQGLAGLNLGLLTPLLVIFFNWIWGIVSATTIRLAK